MGGRTRLRVAAVGLALLLPGVVPAIAVDDTTPPVGSVAVVQDDRDNELVRLSVAATDDASGVATVEVSGDGTTWASYPYAAEVDWAVFDPAAGGDPALGDRTVRVRWTDGVGNTSAAVTTVLYLSKYGALEYPDPPITGELFTIRPIYGPGELPPANSDCSWEMRWGDTVALKDNKPNETFGTMFLSGKPDRGFCGEWTFTVPWVPVRQFEVYFNSWVMATEDDTWTQRAKFYPTVGSTDRRIRTSNLPMVQLLPNKYELVVGQSITYTAYPIGTSLRSDDTWIAYCPNFSCNGGGISYKTKYGGSTFTFTPPFPGTWLVVWSGRFRPFDLNAGYDPKVRRPDYYRPETTAPVQKIGGGTPGTTIPVTVEWSGTDQGWGIGEFKVKRSIDGGPWTWVSLPTPKAKSIVHQLTPGHTYRYRVRAIDRAGNKGAWREGPTFRPVLVDDGGSAITYAGTWSPAADPSAIGGGLHQADAAGASATMSFVGRDVALIAAKGPGMGRAKVYVDGILRSTIDLGAATGSDRQIVFRWHWATAGSHLIRVVAEGTLTRPTITLDAIAVIR